MRKPLDAMRIIHWASGASMPDELPINDPEPDPGLLGPASLSWRLHQEQWLIMAGALAFLMQAAHPKVAQGALDHSGFAEDPYERVSRTIQGMAVLIFGTSHEANAMARNLNRRQESCRYARLLGLTDATLPPTYVAVQQYIRGALASGEIAIGPAAVYRENSPVGAVALSRPSSALKKRV